MAARLGADVAIVGRSRNRLARLERELRATHPAARVESFCRDLSALPSVRALAGELLERLPRIHVLVNNAGVFTKRRAETIDGFETQFAVNHLAPFLLTNLVVDRLIESAPARVVCVASQVERSGRIDFDDLEGRAKYGGLPPIGSRSSRTYFSPSAGEAGRREGADRPVAPPGAFIRRVCSTTTTAGPRLPPASSTAVCRVPTKRIRFS